jgi:hypothetical protein
LRRPGVGRTIASATMRLAAVGVVIATLGITSEARCLEVDAAVGGIMSFRCCSWSIRIAADATTTTDLSPADHRSRKFRLSAKQMGELEALLRREDFLSLDRELGELPIDGPDAQIRVKLGKREHVLVLHSLPGDLVPIWRTDPTQLGRAFRVCEYLRGLLGVSQAMHCPGIPDDESK